MLNKVKQALRDYDMLRGATDITVALSGGADSMALLNALLELKSEFKLNIRAAHLNHCLRGEESVRDEEFVKAECKRLNVELTVQRADVDGFAKENNLSTELAARQIRYDFLKQNSIGLIATAHTASDSLETVLFNLTRGTGIKGLCGIPPVRDVFIRPLIYVTRSEVEQYCRENNIDYVTDSTNLTDDYTRNLIRHKVVPVLKGINSSLENTVSDMTELLRDDERFLSSTALGYFNNSYTENGLDLSDFPQLPRAIATRVLRLFCEKNNIRGINSTHIKSLYTAVLNGNTQIVLPGKTTVAVKSDMLFIGQNLKTQDSFCVEIEQKILKNLKNDEKVNNLFLKNTLDCDKIVGKLIVRTRQAGDTFSFAARGVTKSVKKLFNEEKIPQHLRDTLPVIADDKGVVWIYGFGADRRACATEKSENIYVISAYKE